MNWLTILLQNRNFTLSNQIAIEAKKFLISKYAIDLSTYDLIIGYRADDSYFSFAEDFLNNSISLERLEETMHLGKLGL